MLKPDIARVVSLLDDWHDEDAYVEEIDADYAAELIEQQQEAELIEHERERDEDVEGEDVYGFNHTYSPAAPARTDLVWNAVKAGAPVMPEHQEFAEKLRRFARGKAPAQVDAIVAVFTPAPVLRARATRVAPRRRGTGSRPRVRTGARRSGGTSSRGSPDDEGESEPPGVARPSRALRRALVEAAP